MEAQSQGEKGQQQCSRPIGLRGAQLASQVAVPNERGHCLGIARKENGVCIVSFFCSVFRIGTKKNTCALNDSKEEGRGGNDSPAGGLTPPLG